MTTLEETSVKLPADGRLTIGIGPETPKWARRGNRGRPAMTISLRGETPKGEYVRIDRATRWGNRFAMSHESERTKVIERYRGELWERVRSGEIPLADLAALAGRRLACWCAPRECHGDVLAAAAEWARKRIGQESEAA